MPDLSPSRDLACVTGFFLGDGRSSGRQPKVRFQLADREQLQCVSQLVAKILGRNPKPLSQNGAYFVVDYDSVVPSSFLNQDVETLVEYLKDFIKGFLQGFFDAEGYVSAVIDFKRGTLNSVVVGLANTNLEYHSIVKGILSDLRIDSRIRRTNRSGQEMRIHGRTWIRRKDVYHSVVIGWDMVNRFRCSVGFRNKAKAEKLEDLIQLRNEAPRERYDWFTAHYARRGRKWVKIAKFDSQ